MRVTLHDKKVLEVKEPTEEDQFEYLHVLEEYDKIQKDKGEFEAQKYAMDAQNRFVSKNCEMSVEEVQKMALVDKSKIIEAMKSRMVILGRADQRMDF